MRRACSLLWDNEEKFVKNRQSVGFFLSKTKKQRKRRGFFSNKVKLWRKVKQTNDLSGH